MGRFVEYSFLFLAALALSASGRRLPRGIALHPGGNEPEVLTLPNDRPQTLHLTRTFAHHVPARTVRIVKTVGVKYPVPYPVRNDVVVHVPKPYPVPVPFAQKVPVYVHTGGSSVSSGAAGHGSGDAGYGAGASGYGSGAAEYGSGAAGYEGGAGSDASYHGDASSGLAGADGSSGYGSSGAGFTAPASGFAHGAEGSSFGISPGALVGYAGPSTHGDAGAGFDGAHAAAYTQQSQGHAGLTQAVFLSPGNTGYGDAGQGYENGINAGYAGASGYAPAYSGANHGEGTFVMVQGGAGEGYAQGGGGQNAIGAIDAGYSNQGHEGQEGGDNSGAYATSAGDAYANYGKVPVATAGYQAKVGTGYAAGESQQTEASSNEGNREGVDESAVEPAGQQGDNVKTLVTIEKAIDMGSYSYFGNNAVH